MTKFIPIPEASDYAIAVEIQNEALNARGGAWVAAMRTESETRSKLSVDARSKGAVAIAAILGSGSEGGDAFDRSSPSTRAYKHGLLNGFDIVGLAHGGLVTEKDILYITRAALMERAGEVEDERLWADMLVELSEEGLKRFDAQSIDTIDSWSEEYSREAKQQRLYKLGIGATVLSAHTVHVAFVECYIQYETQSLDWQTLLPADTGE